jgi:hypothetical protein
MSASGGALAHAAWKPKVKPWLIAFVVSLAPTTRCAISCQACRIITSEDFATISVQTLAVLSHGSF